MTYFDAIILAIVEGATEFLPISSTGHLVLMSHVLGIGQDTFVQLFQVAVQLGAVAAVLHKWGPRLLKDMGLLMRVVVAFLPMAIAGFLLYPLIKGFLGNPMIVVWALGIGGVIMIVLEQYINEPATDGDVKEEITYKRALLVGLAQVLALIPGVSRSATTVCAGLAMGMSRRSIVEFSFLLAVPTLSAATALDIMSNVGLITSHTLGLLMVGCGIAYLVARVVMDWLISFVQTHDFTWFGAYRIVVAIVAWFFIA
jgi:undecaprenyl-diphosphatase